MSLNFTEIDFFNDCTFLLKYALVDQENLLKLY